MLHGSGRARWLWGAVILIGCVALLAGAKDRREIYLAKGGSAFLVVERGLLGGLKITESSFLGGTGIVQYELLKDQPRKGWRTLRFKWDLAEAFPVKWQIDYQLAPSKSIPGDWDLVSVVTDTDDEMLKRQASEWPTETADASYLHRIDDDRILEYFDPILADAEATPEESAQKMANEDRLTTLSTELLKAHPDDLFVRILYLDALMWHGRDAELERVLDEWEAAYKAAPSQALKSNYLLAASSLEAKRLSATGRNAYAFVNGLLKYDLDTQVRELPRVLGMTEFASGLTNSLVRVGGTRFLDHQVFIKNMRLRAVFMMLHGQREKAMELGAACYYYTSMFEGAIFPVERMLGATFRAISAKTLELIALNGCETREEYERLWTYLQKADEVATSSIQDKTIAWGDPQVTRRNLLSVYLRASMEESVQEETRLRSLVGKTNFGLVRMATAARHHLVVNGAWPQEGEKALGILLPDGSPDDPYTSPPAPLRWFAKETTLTCYSVGPDAKDDHARVVYDSTNGVVSAGDMILEVPRERTQPFPRGGTFAASRAEFDRQYPNGLPLDPYANKKGRQLSVTRNSPLLVYSFGPDVDQFEVDEIGPDYRPAIQYDPTNGVVSRGDIFTTVPQSAK